MRSFHRLILCATPQVSFTPILRLERLQTCVGSHRMNVAGSLIWRSDSGWTLRQKPSAKRGINRMMAPLVSPVRVVLRRIDADQAMILKHKQRGRNFWKSTDGLWSDVTPTGLNTGDVPENRSAPARRSTLRRPLYCTSSRRTCRSWKVISPIRGLRSIPIWSTVATSTPLPARSVLWAMADR